MNPCALGWDNHRKFSRVSVMEQTPDGEIRAVERTRLEHNDKAAMRAWLSHLALEIPVALEATFGWPWVADLLEELGHPVHLGHPPARPACNWAVRCRIPILCRAGRHVAENRNVPVASGCPNT